MNSKRTQPYIYMYLFSPKHPSHPGWHITLSKSSICYIMGLYESSVLNTAVCTWPSRGPWLSLPLATISLFSKSVSLFLLCEFICVISFQIPHISDVIWYISFSDLAWSHLVWEKCPCQLKARGLNPKERRQKLLGTP